MNDQQIEAAIDQLVESPSTQTRLAKLISSGIDIYVMNIGESIPVIVYNSGAKSGSPAESVATMPAYDAIAGYLLQGAEDSGEDEFGEGGDELEGYVDQYVEHHTFFDPASWKPLTAELLADVMQAPTTDMILVTDHNGSSVEQIDA